jgi:hypothetical protein
MLNTIWELKSIDGIRYRLEIVELDPAAYNTGREVGDTLDVAIWWFTERGIEMPIPRERGR